MMGSPNEKLERIGCRDNKLAASGCQSKTQLGSSSGSILKEPALDLRLQLNEVMLISAGYFEFFSRVATNPISAHVNTIARKATVQEAGPALWFRPYVMSHPQ